MNDQLVRQLLTRDLTERRERKWELFEIEYNHKYDFGYSLIIPFLMRHYGNVAVCGGYANCMTRITQHYVDISPFILYDLKDADFFIYGVTEDEANAIADDFVAFLCSSVDIFKEDENNFTEVRFDRKKYVINVVITSNNNGSFEKCSYQLILRVYPTLDSIIGGFDISPCMYAFDGCKLWTNSMGLDFLKHNEIIIDISRRSLSFENRLLKYARRIRCDIRIPGFDEIVAKKKKKQLQTKDHLAELETVFYGKLHKLGYNVSNDIQSKVHSLIGGIQNDDINTVMNGSTFKINIPNGYYGQIYHTPRGPNMRMFGTELGHREVTSEALNKYSDYGDNASLINDNISKANRTFLNADKYDYITLYKAYSGGKDIHRVSYNNILSDWNDMKANPLKFFHVKIYDEIQDENDIYELYKRIRYGRTQYIKAIGKFANDLLKKDFVKEVNQSNDYVKSRIADALTHVAEIKWNTQTPGQQWTASFNPTISHPMEFYGEFWKGFQIGIPTDIETTLRMGWKSPESLLSNLNHDVFRLLLKCIVRQYW